MVLKIGDKEYRSKLRGYGAVAFYLRVISRVRQGPGASKRLVKPRECGAISRQVLRLIASHRKRLSILLLLILVLITVFGMVILLLFSDSVCHR